MTNEIPLQAVEIEINSACNRVCSYCPNSIAERKTKGVMDIALYKIILANLSAVTFKGRISYSFYNEPTLHPHLLTFVKLTKEILPDSKIQLYSNGTLLNAKYTLELFAAGVDQMVITRHEQDITSDKYLFENTLKELTETERRKVIYKNFGEINLVNRGGLLKHISATGLVLQACYIPSHMLTFTVDGRVLSCFEDFNENLIFGDIKTEKLIDIWNKDSYKLFRENLKKGLRHLHTPCKECSRTEALPPFDV